MPFLWLDSYLDVLISYLLNIKSGAVSFFPSSLSFNNHGDWTDGGGADGWKCTVLISLLREGGREGVPWLIAVVYISYHIISARYHGALFRSFDTRQLNAKFGVIYPVILLYSYSSLAP